MKIKFIHEDDIKGKSLPGRTSKVLIGPETAESKNLGFIITVMEPRTIQSPPHAHPAEDEVIYVIDGEGEITSGNEKADIYPGIAMYVPAGVLHNIENKSDREMKLACCFNPPIGLDSIPIK
jgi:mannose-6-phosphate isomerase-like protein (cupin superfamily)